MALIKSDQDIDDVPDFSDGTVRTIHDARTPLVADLRIRRPQAIRVPGSLAHAVLALAAIDRGAILLR